MKIKNKITLLAILPLIFAVSVINVSIYVELSLDQILIP